MSVFFRNIKKGAVKLPEKLQKKVLLALFF